MMQFATSRIQPKGRALHAAEKLVLAKIGAGFVTGHDFRRAANAIEGAWALAPEGGFPKPSFAMRLSLEIVGNTKPDLASRQLGESQ
jgi:hypothetical protein